MASVSVKAVPEDLKTEVRAVLLSKIGGVPIDKFIKDYNALLGQNFPYKKLGYATLRQCLGAMPDVVRFEVKSDGTERLYGIADDTSFMSSFAIKAQFPEFEEKKDKRKKNNTKHGHVKGQAISANSKILSSSTEDTGSQSVAGNLTSKKYPTLMSNMKGLYGVVVQGASVQGSQDIETLFCTIGPVAERSSCGNLLFYRFKNIQHAEMVIDKFNGFELGRFKLHIEPAKEKKGKQHNPVGSTTLSEVNSVHNGQARSATVQEQKQSSNTSSQAKSHCEGQMDSTTSSEKPFDELRKNGTSPTELKIQEISESLKRKMSGQTSVTQKHHGIVQKAVMTVATDSKHTNHKHNATLQNNHLQSNRMSTDSKRSSSNSHQQCGDSKHSNARQGGAHQEPLNSRQDNYIDVFIGNIANNLLEKDVKAFMAPYKPKHIKFQYPSGSHRCFTAVAKLGVFEAEKAIQTLNGRIMYDLPLCVRPCTKTTNKKERVLNYQSDSCSASDLDTVTKAKVTQSKPSQKVDISDSQGNSPMPSLADYIDRFSDLNV